MSRKLPVIPTLIVAPAVRTMIGLGIWQLQRARKRGAARPLCRRREPAADRLADLLPRPEPLPLFRHRRELPVSRRQARRAGQNRQGEPGSGHHRRLPHRRRRAGHERRARLVEGPDAGRAGAAGWSAGSSRPTSQPDAAGRGDAPAGAAASAAAVADHPQQPSVLCRPVVPLRRPRRSSTCWRCGKRAEGGGRWHDAADHASPTA